MSDEKNDDGWVHISEVARAYNISLGTVSGWWKEAPKEHKKRVANLKQLRGRYVMMRVARMKVALLQKSVSMPGMPYIKLTDNPEEEPSPNAIAATVRKAFPEFDWLEE